jgi:hypothetical protein
VLVMNLVLHTFESMYTSIILFAILGCFLSATKPQEQENLLNN